MNRALLSGAITARMADLLLRVSRLTLMSYSTLTLAGIETPKQLALARQVGLQ